MSSSEPLPPSHSPPSPPPPPPSPRTLTATATRAAEQARTLDEKVIEAILAQLDKFAGETDADK